MAEGTIRCQYCGCEVTTLSTTGQTTEIHTVWGTAVLFVDGRGNAAIDYVDEYDREYYDTLDSKHENFECPECGVERHSLDELVEVRTVAAHEFECDQIVRVKDTPEVERAHPGWPGLEVTIEDMDDEEVLVYHEEDDETRWMMVYEIEAIKVGFSEGDLVRVVKDDTTSYVGMTGTVLRVYPDHYPLIGEITDTTGYKVQLESGRERFYPGNYLESVLQLTGILAPEPEQLQEMVAAVFGDDLDSLLNELG